MKTLVIAIVLNLAIVANCQVNSEIAIKVADVLVKAGHVLEPIKEVDVARAGVKVPDYDLDPVKATDQVEHKVAESVEPEAIKTEADTDTANIQPLASDDGDEDFGLLTDSDFMYSVQKVDEELYSDSWWDDLAGVEKVGGDDWESGESEESDDSESEESDDSESEESDEDEVGKYRLKFKIHLPVDKFAQWIQGIKQQQPILAEDNYDTKILEKDSASSWSGEAIKQAKSLDDYNEQEVNDEVPSKYANDADDYNEADDTFETINNMETLKKDETNSVIDQQPIIAKTSFNDESDGRPRHVFTAFHYIFFAISGALFIFGLMVIVGAIIRNMRYKKPGYIILIETGTSGKM